MKKRIKIAIADDHKLVRSGIAMILGANSDFMVVQQAGNGRDLLDGMNERIPDVILLDLEMPVLSGKETLIEIKKSYPQVKVLILTMHKNEAFIIQMMELGANGYLIKSTDPDEVVQAIYKVCTTGFYFSDLVSIAMLHGISEGRIEAATPLPEHGLSSREVDVLRLICKEHTTAEIGKALFLSVKTIEGYRKALMDKTQARNMAGLVLYAIRHHLYTVS